MLSVEEALGRVLARAFPRPIESCACRDALGLVLAEEINSDVDSPPYDKSIVDGYAVVASDLASGLAVLEVIEEITAGDVPHRAVTSGTTARIMTGAPIPEGADAVIMVEQSELDGTQVRLAPPRFKLGQNIMRRAASMARGDVVLSAGRQLGAPDLGVLAEVGRTQVTVVPRPKLAVLSTGNELVPPEVVPGPGHIRNSNSLMLTAAAQQAGAVCRDLGIARDEPETLRAMIKEGLRADILLLSGGVSAGVLDLVPGILVELGVEPVFHKVNIKPGKPLWFGVLAAEGGDKLVFGLPGNPVSSFVGFEVFVKPAIARLAGREPSTGELTAILSREFSHRGNRPSYHPAILQGDSQVPRVEPLVSQGSADLRTLAQANALICFPPGDYALSAGASVRIRLLSE